MNRLTQSIAIKVSSVIFLVLMSFSVISLAGFIQIVRGGFLRVEDTVAADDKFRIERLFEAEAERLAELCREFAIWDETLGFLESRDTSYFKKNMYAEWRFDVGLHLIAFLDREKKMIFAFRADTEDIGFLDESDRETSALLQNARKISSFDEGGAGITFSNGSFLLFSMEPVLSSDGSGPAGGYLIFSKSLDRTFFERLSALATVEVAQAHVNSLGGIERDEQIILETFSVCFNDNQGIPVTVTRNRDLWKIGERLLIGFGFEFFAAAMAASSILLFLLRKAVIKPIYEISSHLGGVILKNDFSRRLISSGKNELALLAEDINSLLIHIQNREAELKRLNHELECVANTDQLTGLANRRSFAAHLQEEFRRMHREARGGAERGKITFLLCDVDHFKAYNDTYGHLAGDSCLAAIGNALGTCMRRPGDFVCRYGGEDFLVILPNCGPKGARVLADNILSAIRALAIPHSASSAADIVTISIGGAVFAFSDTPEAPLDMDICLAGADAALYRAKKEGRNRYCE